MGRLTEVLSYDPNKMKDSRLAWISHNKILKTRRSRKKDKK